MGGGLADVGTGKEIESPRGVTDNSHPGFESRLI